MTVLRERGHDDVVPAAPRGGVLTAFVLRHPVLCVVLLAFGVRALLAVIINVVSGGSLFQDDSTYPLLAAQHAFGETETWGEYEYFLFDVTATLLLPLSWLYQWFGYSVLAGQLLVAGFAALAAGAVTRLAMESLPRRWALFPGGVVALLPSQVLFSSTVFKDAAVWAVLAGLALVVALLGRSSGWRAAVLLVAVGVLYFLLSHLRLHTLVAAAWAASLAVFAMPGGGRVLQRTGMLALTLFMPFALGLGMGGWGFIVDASATLEQRRLGNAAGAATAFVQPVPEQSDNSGQASGSAGTPPGQPSGSAGTPDAEPGAAAPPSRIDPDAGEATAGGRNPRALLRGLSVMLLEPYPTPSTFENRNVTFALVENLVWWPLLALAAVGLLRVRRERRVLAFPLLVAGAIVLLYSLSEGNFGTAYRHRGEVVWAVALLAAYGARSLLARRGLRSAA